MLAFIFFALLSINDPNNLQDGNSTIKHHKHIFKNRCDGKQKKCQNKKTEKPSRNCNPQTRHSTQSSQQGKAQNEPLQNASYPTECKSLTRKKSPSRPGPGCWDNFAIVCFMEIRFLHVGSQSMNAAASGATTVEMICKHNQQGKGLVDLLAVHSKCTFAFALPRNITELLRTYLYTSHKHYVH